jgi:hypothetical protein
MTYESWRTAFASVIGSSHLKTKAPCQDNGLCSVVTTKAGAEVLIAIVSDGAGSSPKSEVGSALVVNSFIAEFGNFVATSKDITSIKKEDILVWLSQVRQEVQVLADIDGREIKDFACTALGAIVDTNQAVFFQIGDGAIVISEKGSQEFSPMFWPQHGEFANQTNFITQSNIEDLLEFVNLSQQFDQIALFTDGLERLILNFSSKTVYAPSLDSIFAWLKTIEQGQRNHPSEAFIAYLNSDQINKRTDDDKTLVMATRRQVDL